MTDGSPTVTIPGDDPTAVALLGAVHGGDVDLVRRLLTENPDLARARFAGRGGTGTALHFVTDWPRYFPKGPEIVNLLVGPGADPNALTTGGGSDTPGPGSETPLHYAASSDDCSCPTSIQSRFRRDFGMPAPPVSRAAEPGVRCQGQPSPRGTSAWLPELNGSSARAERAPIDCNQSMTLFCRVERSLAASSAVPCA
jgi:hypothetical protein